jgi:hypothetical protein
MSHHFDYPQDETLDITDAYCFAGASDLHGPRTVFGMNSSPSTGSPWNTAGYYELKIDTNGDYVEDITFRATFPIGADGTQYVQVEQLTGRAATDRASGTIITPPNAPVGEVVECLHGIKVFAGQRLDPFYNFIPFPVATFNALKTGSFPDYDALRPATDSFMNNTVRSYVLELPLKITGHGTVNNWATTTAYFDKGHNTCVQLQRAAEPNMTTFFASPRARQRLPTTTAPPPRSTSWAGPPTRQPDPASGIWGQVRDNIAAVVEAGGTYRNHPHRFRTALAYGAWAADTLLPNVITFTPGTVAFWDPWFDIQNGKGITEDIASNIIKMMVNEDFSSGLKPGPVLDYFPYLAPPPVG